MALLEFGYWVCSTCRNPNGWQLPKVRLQHVLSTDVLSVSNRQELQSHAKLNWTSTCLCVFMHFFYVNQIYSLTLQLQYARIYYINSYGIDIINLPQNLAHSVVIRRVLE